MGWPVSGSSFQMAKAVTPPTTASVPKMARQPRASSMAEPMAGAMPGPIIIIRLSSARLPTAFSGVLESRAMARPRARPAQPPSAWSSRAPISQGADGARKAARLASA